MNYQLENQQEVIIMKKLQTVLTGCILTAALLAAGGCNKQPSSSLSYQDILENGLGLSQSEVVSRYQIDESVIEKDQSADKESWTLAGQDNLLGDYSGSVILTFEEDSLTRANFCFSIDNDEQQTWQTLMDVYDDMLETLGEPSSNWTSQQPFGRFEDYTDFQETVTPLLETEGMYTESNNWLLSEQTDSDGADANRAELSLSMFESGNSTVEVIVSSA